jgi:hypothetical protein
VLRAEREILGFRLSETLVAEIQELDLQRVGVPAPPILWLDTGEPRLAAGLLAQLASRGMRPQYRHVPTSPVWVKMKDGDEFGGGMVPNDVLETILTYLTGAAS